MIDKKLAPDDSFSTDVGSLCAKIVARGLEIDELEAKNRGYLEIIKCLIHSLHKVEVLQESSYGFLNDDKKMAEHFRLKFPVTQGLFNRMRVERVYNYVEKNGFDSEAAGEALVEIEERLTKGG